MARWEVDGDGSYAVALCPQCGAPVAADRTRCADCGAGYRVEPLTASCPDCHGSGHPACAACEGTGRCPICEGSGVYEGAICPECEGRKVCPTCEGVPPTTACDNCGGKGSIEIR